MLLNAFENLRAAANRIQTSSFTMLPSIRDFCGCHYVGKRGKEITNCDLLRKFSLFN